jgi:SAM-dependent methyltransferase
MKEAEIRPEHLLQRYLELSAEDAERCFVDASREAIACVACGADGAEPQFVKHGFVYARCGVCGTLYQSPRPKIKAFEHFYRDSASSRFWAEEFFPAVAEARRDSIFRPRVERLASLCAAKGITVETLVDVGAGFGIFLEEWRRRFPRTELLAVEPGAKLAQICRDRGFAVVEDIVENVTGFDGRADLVVCFEVLEHVYDPVSFIRILSRLVKPGGHVFVSTLGVDGWDIQTLWEHSNSIFPPHHINFLSLKGFEQAFTRAGLADIDISTPGKLDVDIVRNAHKRDPDLLKNNHFAQLLVQDAERGAIFQRFLADNRLSSHTWVLAQKPGD